MNQPGLAAEPVLIDLDEESFRALGARLDGWHGPLSPWNGVDVTVTGTQRAKLRELGVTDNNAIPANLRSPLATIASATGKTAVTVVVGGMLVQTIVFTSNGHGVALSAASMNEMLRLEDPARSDELLGFVTGIVGRSRLRGLEVSLDLSIRDAFALAALIDLHRRHTFGQLAMGETPSVPSLSLQAVRNVLANPPTGGFWFVDAIARACDTEPTTVAARLDGSIEQLARRNVIAVTGAAAQPVGMTESLAEHFLRINTVVELQNVSLDDHSRPQHLGFTCLQAGVSDLMTIEWTQSGIHLETVSADALIGYIDRLVRQPDYIRRPATAPEPHGESTPPSAQRLSERDNTTPLVVPQLATLREHQ